MSALIQFDHNISAHALANADGLQLGERTLKTRVFNDGQPSGANFDPFAENFGNHWLDEVLKRSGVRGAVNTEASAPGTPRSQSVSQRTVRLSADSRPFVPSTLKKLDLTPRSPEGSDSPPSKEGRPFVPSTLKKLDLTPRSPEGSDSPPSKEGTGTTPSSTPSVSSRNVSRCSSVATAFSGSSAGTAVSDNSAAA
jgi:hypothetical protein